MPMDRIRQASRKPGPRRKTEGVTIALFRTGVTPAGEKAKAEKTLTQSQVRCESATISATIRKGVEDMFSDRRSREVDNVSASDDEIRPLTAQSLSGRFF